MSSVSHGVAAMASAIATSARDIATFSNTANTSHSGLSMFLKTLTPTALLAASRPSGTDEFASWTMGPALMSPFNCLSEIVSTVIWIGYGWANGLTWAQRARLVIEKSTVSGGDHQREFSKIKTSMLALPLLYSLFRAFEIYKAEGFFWETTGVFLFLARFTLRICMEFLARNTSAQDLPGGLRNRNQNENELVQQILYGLDIGSSVAYACQAKAWIDIFGNLSKVFAITYGEKPVDSTIIAMIIVAGFISYFTPQAGPNQVLRGLWRMRQTKSEHKHTIIFTALIIFLMLGLPRELVPFGRATNLIATPHSSLLAPLMLSTLGTLSVVVFTVSIVSISYTNACKLAKSFGIEIPVDGFETPTEELLATRLNPVVNSPRKWREILSLSYALTNFLFGFFYYLYVHPNLALLADGQV